jgi:tight adherence protein C
MLLLIAVTTFAAVALVAWALLRPVERPIERRLGIARTAAGIGTGASFGQRVILPSAARLGKSLSRLLPQNLVVHIERMLVMAGSRMRLLVFLGLWVGWVLAADFFLGMVWFIFLGGLHSFGDENSIRGLLVLLLVVMALDVWLALVPYLLLLRRVKRRQRAIVRALPNALDLLVACVEAGLGTDSALRLVGQRSPGPLGESLVQYDKLVALGQERRTALRAVADRTGVGELGRLANAMAQAEEMGTALGDVLRVQAEDVREGRRTRAREAAQRAPVLMTIPLAVCFVPALFVVILVPSALHIFQYLGNLGA